jgi:hypothetical protein
MGETSMPHLQLTDVESTNLHMLCAIRLGVEQDRVGASSKFALSAALADRLRTLDHDKLWSFVNHVGQITLFPPRQDLLALLEAPVPLAGPLAVVHALRPALLRSVT